MPKRLQEAGIKYQKGGEKNFTPIPKADWKNLTPKQYGGQAIINKEAAKHGVSSSDKKYASDLYAGASKGQKKKAVDMYKQYQSTGQIPEGAEELYKSAGGNRFLQEGGRVGPLRKRTKEFGTREEPMSFSEDKVVKVTDSRGKTRKTKVKNEHGKFKDKMDKYGNLKKSVTWKDGKRTVEKFKSGGAVGRNGIL